MLGLGKPDIQQMFAQKNVKKLVKTLGHKDADVRIAAIQALAEIGDHSAEQPLIELLMDNDDAVAHAAENALQKMGLGPASKPKDSGQQTASQDVTPEQHSTDVVISPGILNLIKTKQDLPPLPEVVAKINEKLKDPDSSIKTITRLIAADPALTAHIIKVSNSAYYSAGRVTIKDLTMAIGRLGLTEIKNIVISFSLMNAFKDSILFDQMNFWRHSLAVGFCANALGRVMKLDAKQQEMAYLAGLMHDIGIMVFTYLAPDSYSNFLRKIVGDHKDNPAFELQKLEETSFMANHSSVGAAYVDYWWPLDKMVVHAIQYHHRNASAQKLEIVSRLVILANDYCNSKEINNGVNVRLQKDTFTRDRFDALQMNDEQVEQFETFAKKGLEATDLILSL